MTPTRAAIASAIAEAEAELRRLEGERTAVAARLAGLRNELAAIDGRRPDAPRDTTLVAPPPEAPRTPGEKVRLFRELFRGRPDIYPTRFVSKKTGKPGYAPVCADKFIATVCGLPKVKCGDCHRQAFRPVDDAAIISHLTGEHVMGVRGDLRFGPASGPRSCAPFGLACDALGRDLLVSRR